MKRFLAVLMVFAVILLVVPIPAHAGNVELGDLTALTTPAGEDLLLIVDDPSSTATAKKITYSYLVLNPTDAVSITDTGTATSNLDILSVTNKANAASMTGTGTSILANQWYYDASTPAIADIGRLSFKTEGNWTSTASTQDGSYTIGTALNGTITDQVVVSSAGLMTVTGGVTTKTGTHVIVGTTQWDNGSDAIDGERIADDTIDDDSIDFGDVTGADLTLTDCDAITIVTGHHLILGTTQWDDGSDAIDGEKIAADTIDDDSIDFADVTGVDLTLTDVTYFNSTKYAFIDDFDYEAATVQFESGLQADAYVTAGTNYAAANVTFTAGVGGTLACVTAGADDDSVTIVGVPNYNTTQNPIFEARFKIADITNAAVYVGFVEGSYADKAALDDDIAVIGFDSDNAHTLGAARIFLLTNDNNGGADYDDTGVDIVAGTYVIVKIDLTDTEQPRAWVNGAEVAAGSISGTVQSGATFMPYIMVQSLSGAADTLTVDYIKCWQDRG